MRGIELLHPDMRAKAEEFKALCAANNLPVLITETWRSEHDQTELYAKGRTTPGKIVTNCRYPQSPHCWGVAFDFCRNVKGQEYTNGDGFFQKVGKLGKSIGLFWGGDFKSFVDMPHLEHPFYVVNNSTKTLVSNWGNPENFKANWHLKPVPVPTPEPAPNPTPSIWAAEAWAWAVSRGLTDGTNPQAAVTREMMITLLWKYDAQR